MKTVYNHATPLAELSILEMVDHYNEIMDYIDRSGDKVKTFRDRPTAERRLTGARVEYVAQHHLDTSPGLARLRAAPGADALRNAVLDDQAKATAIVADGRRTTPLDPPADYPPPAEKKRPGRKATWPDHARIHLIFPGNPKRRGTNTFRNYAKLREGMTVAEYGEALGDRSIALGELGWNVRHNFVRIES